MTVITEKLQNDVFIFIFVRKEPIPNGKPQKSEYHMHKWLTEKMKFITAIINLMMRFAGVYLRHAAQYLRKIGLRKWYVQQ